MPQKIGRYEILSALGEGQYGNVWLAVGEVPGRHGQPGKRRTVAVKRLRDDADAESLRLLVQEFALLDQVKHRSIVRVYEYLPTERAVVMEAVQGLPLRGVIDACNQAREPIPTEAVIEMVCEIADGLYQAYTSPGDNGEPLALVHRDLKPENIMLTPTGEVKILDFGLARVGNAEFTREDPRWIKGTPIYMAPEQARGEELDHRADLFALGLILYELLMGQPAYQAPPGAKDPAQAMYQAIEQGDLAGALHELGNRLPAVGRIITQLLNPRPHLRYQTGQDLLVDLRQLYRDRSSNLKNFCTYFFESIHRLPAQPEPDPGARMMDEKSPRKSIEERLREKEAGIAAPPPPPPAQPRSAGIAVVRRSAPAPEPSPPPAPPPAPPPVAAAAPKSTAVPPRIVPRTASAARPAPSPEEDALPSVRGGKKPAATPARSADEPGMLQMKPLSALQDEGEPTVDPSATAFFAIPAPKSQAPKPSIPDDPPPVSGVGGGGAMGGPSTMAGPPPSTMDRPAYSPPGAIGMGSASSPMMTAAGTPFGVNGPAPQGNANRERDVETSRVWVLVVGMFAMMCLLAITAVATLILLPKTQEKPTEPPPVAKNDPPPEEPPEEEPVAVVQPQPRKISGGGGAPKPPAEPKPPPAASDKLTIKFPGSPAPSSLELVCDGGYRNRATVQGGAANFSGVPGGACTLSPKGGGVVASNAPVKAGRTYTCEIRGSTMNCN